MVSHSSGSTSDRRPGEPGRRRTADGTEAGTTAHAALADPVAAELAAELAAMEAEQELSADGGTAGPRMLAVPEDAAGAEALAAAEAAEPETGRARPAEAGAEAAEPESGLAGPDDAAAGAGVGADAAAGADAGTDAEASDPAGTAAGASAEAPGPQAGSAAGTPPPGTPAAGIPSESAAPEPPIEAAAEGLVEAADAATVRPNRRAQAARLAFLALTLAAGAYAVARQWGRVREGFEDLGPLPLIIALVPALASIWAMMLAWRGLLGSLGSPLRLRPASRIFFTSQLGKYLPGSVWPVVAQMQLGRAYRIPRARSAAAAALAMLISLVTALVLAAVTLSVAGGAQAAGYWWAFAAVPVLLAGLHPRVANPVLKTIFRITRRPTIEPLTGETIRKTAARSLMGWLLAGAHIWVLCIALGAAPWRALLLGIGGYAFAWSVGFLIVFAPAGAGVRELILVAALQPVLDPGKATVVALASRLVTIVADLVAAAPTARGGGAVPAADSDEVGDDTVPDSEAAPGAVSDY